MRITVSYIQVTGKACTSQSDPMTPPLRKTHVGRHVKQLGDLVSGLPQTDDIVVSDDVNRKSAHKKSNPLKDALATIMSALDKDPEEQVSIYI